jgi:outer membrane receptor for ferrienterochelin and colicins
MTKRDSYYGSDMDPDAFGRTSDMTVSTGAQWTHGMEKFWFMPAELVAGVEYNYNYLHDVTLGYDHDVTQRVNIYSAYAQNEWRDDRWGFLVGARLDKHSLISSPIFSPRLNLRYNPRNNVNLRLSYATGFRSPQAYDEDFHVAVVGGERVVTILAPGLKQERSNSLSASADIYPRFGSVMTNFTFEAFYTDLSDVFAIRKLDEPDEKGNTVLERYNGGGATVAGFNFEAGARFSSRFQSQLGLTWQRSRYKDPEEWSEDPLVPAVKRMFRTPDLYGYLTLNYNVTKKLVLGFTSTYTGSMLVQHFAGSGTDIDVAVTTPSFFDASFKASYCFEILGHVDVDVSASIDNIFNAYQKDFDQGALRDSGYMYGPMTPRSLTFGIKLSI